MNNITKNRQSKEQLHKIIEKVFQGKVTLTDYRELTDGFCNVAYDLVLSDGRQAILKIAPPTGVQMMSCEAELMKTEVFAMRLAAEHQIPGVARIYAYDDSRELCTGEYFIMEKLAGQGCHVAKQDMTDEQRAEIDFKVGQLLHKIHQIKGKTFGHLCVKVLQNPVWFDAFYSMVEGVIGDGVRAGIEIGVDYDEILALLKKHKEAFLEVKEPELVHFDSWDGNIFVKDGEIVGLIDWERALWAEGLMEDRFRFHSVTDAFRRGYGLETLTESQQLRSRWYDIYLYLIMMFEGTYRQYETDEQYRWVHELFMKVWKQLK